MKACFHLPSVVCENCRDEENPHGAWSPPSVRRYWDYGTWVTNPATPPDSYTRQQVEAMLRVALTDRTDEWTIKSIDERVSILLAMFTKEKP
jgi:hypothetical protein